jgi:hypothetical protein
MKRGWQRGLIVLATASVLSVGTVAPASAAEITSKPTVSVSCDATNLCKETVTATFGRVTYTVVITFVDIDKSGSLNRGDQITSVTVSRA